MKKLSTKLFREEYQQVLTALKQANSVMGDEMDHLLDNLQVIKPFYSIILHLKMLIIDVGRS